MDASDRRLQVLPTLEAKIAADFSLVRAILAFAGFVSALRGCERTFVVLSQPLSDVFYSLGPGDFSRPLFQTSDDCAALVRFGSVS